MSVARVGVLGGTFDPIHDGHLAAGQAAKAALALDRILVVPSHDPPHRPDSPRASGYHRLQMARLGVADRTGWDVSDLELVRGGHSYTFDTLTTLRGLEPASQFFFITGADAFAEVASWRRYPEVLELSSFVVIARTGTSFEAVRARLPELEPRFVHCDAVDAEACRRAPFPSIFLVHAVTPAVSSTEVRRRAAAALPLDGFVPAVVRRYIHEHHLYV
jgi:nicotinate-nucleotide adenylyltransferase